MTKISIIILVYVLASYRLNAQKNDDLFLSLILKNQKGYLQKLSKTERNRYGSIISLAPWIRPKVFSDIKQIDSTILAHELSNFNILEGYDSPHGYLIGVIWSDSLFFEYTDPPTLKAGKELKLVKKNLMP